MSTQVHGHLVYHIAREFGRENFSKFALFEHLAKKVWQINRSAKRLLILSTNLNDFNLISLANHRQFVKFTKLSLHQTLPLYSSSLNNTPPMHIIQ